MPDPIQPRMTRQIHPMPDDVARALREHGLEDAYQNRPPYQRNDYLGWIERAKLEATRARRIDGMIAELKHGGLYMKMAYRGGKPSQDAEPG